MEDSTYFVAWRLAKSQHLLRFDERTVVVDAIKRFVQERYDVLAYVVMDDHVHVVVTPVEAFSLQAIVHTWKSFTANRLQRDFGRIGAIWQREYFDRIIRDEAELLEKIEYVLGNPIKRWPGIQDYRWAGYG
jgi:REP element-mobilizing transposase RayT